MSACCGIKINGNQRNLRSCARKYRRRELSVFVPQKSVSSTINRIVGKKKAIGKSTLPTAFGFSKKLGTQ